MAGLRLNSFSVLGGSPYYLLDDDGNIMETLDYGSGSFVKTYLLLEPRAGIHYRLGECYSLKAGFSRNSQNIHVIGNLPADISRSEFLPFVRGKRASPNKNNFGK